MCMYICHQCQSCEVCFTRAGTTVVLILQVLVAHYRWFDSSIHWTSTCYILCKCPPTTLLYQLYVTHALFALDLLTLGAGLCGDAGRQCGATYQVKMWSEQ